MEPLLAPTGPYRAVRALLKDRGKRYPPRMRHIAWATAVIIFCGCAPAPSAPDAGASPVDAGLPPVNAPLTQAILTMTVSFDDLDGTAAATASFATSTGRVIALAGMQSVAMGPHGGNLTMLSAGDGGASYSATFAVPTSTTQVDIKVDEPSVGVATSTITVPAAVVIVAPAPNSVGSLSGFTVNWMPADSPTGPRLTNSLTLSQSGASPPDVSIPLADDPGTFSVTASELNPFTQGTPLILGVQVGDTQMGGIQVLASSSLSIQRLATESLNPGP